MTAPTQTPPEAGTNEGGSTVTLELTREQHDRLLGLLDGTDAAPSVAGRGSGDTGAPAEGSSSDGVPAGATTNLDREDEGPDAVELMRGEIEVERSARIELERELNRARAVNEIEALANTGLAPAIIDAARPLLEIERGSGAIELSRDARGRVRSLDPTQIVRDVLHQVIELSRRGTGVIDLDQESGMHVGGEAEQAERSAKLKAWDEQFPEG